MTRHYVNVLVIFLALASGTGRGLAQQTVTFSDLAPETDRVVLVVPFSNLRPDPVDHWIGLGIAESLANDLQSTTPLRVIKHLVPLNTATSRTVDQFEYLLERALTEGQKSGAHWVIYGTYLQQGNDIEIIAKTVEVPTNTEIRTVRETGLIADLFRLQDIIANKLAGSFLEGTVSTLETDSTRLTEIDGPPAPSPPEVINRNESGQATVRAVKINEPIRLDGTLDENVYKNVLPISGFIQQIPNEGAPASEVTEAWLFFDDSNIYIGARCYDSAPPNEWVANDMRRDTSQLRQNDTLAVIFDTFYDRRNGVAFYTNPLGARADFAITNEGNPNSDWNPVWDVRTGRFEGGWTVEMEIPFKSLRYHPGTDQVWGFQMRRVLRRKNEGAYLTALPISASVGGAIGGIFRVSDAATLVGLEVPQNSRNIEIKPYAIGGTTTDLTAIPTTHNVWDGDIGVDVKIGITQNLTADFTYNTDFAQVEVDEQQVNLTRFNLFFPEKREFFLEGRGIFQFATGAAIGGPGGFRDNNAPILFYSRRIGLQNNQVIPIIGGGRLTGKVGSFDVGALNIQTDDEPNSSARQTNFTVMRLKRDILRKSSIGTLLTNRSVSTNGNGSAQTYGVDGNFSFFENVHFLGYYAQTEAPGMQDQNSSYQAKFDYAGDTYAFRVNHLLVEDNFNPEIGFVRRDNFRRTFVSTRYSPRPSRLKRVRQFNFGGMLDYILTADTSRLETRVATLGLETEFENSDRLTVVLNDNHELLHEAFSPGDGFMIPIGEYDFTDTTFMYRFGQQRRANGSLSLRTGGYYNGDITSLDFGGGYIKFTQHLSLEPSVSFNWIDLPEDSFRTDLVRTRLNYTFTPRMFFAGLVQYNSTNESIGANLRFRWEYSPGSELFIVYTEDRHTTPLRPSRTTELMNRGFVVKINKLFRL